MADAKGPSQEAVELTRAADVAGGIANHLGGNLIDDSMCELGDVVKAITPLVLAALRAEKERTLRESEDLLELAWGVIANAGEGSWHRESEEWQGAAERWRDRWLKHIKSDQPARALSEFGAPPEDTRLHEQGSPHDPFKCRHCEALRTPGAPPEEGR